MREVNIARTKNANNRQNNSRDIYGYSERKVELACLCKFMTFSTFFVTFMLTNKKFYATITTVA